MNLRSARVLVAALLLTSSCAMANRYYDDVDTEEWLVKCESEPSCAAQIDRVTAEMESRQRKAQARYDAKPFREKLEPYLVIGVVGWLIWKWAGRQPPKK